MPAQGDGYYIAPSGDIIELDTSHIDLVLKNPEKFLMTKKEIVEIYKKYNEPVGLEGKAREEILVNLIKQGWIRVRYIPKNDSFTVQLNRLDRKRKDMLAAFAKEALDGIKGKKYNKSTDARILNLQGDVLGGFTLQQLSEDVLYKEAKKAKVIKISQYNPTIIQKVIKKLNK